MRSVLAHMRTAIGSAGDRNQAQMWTETVEDNCMSFAVVQVLGTGMTRGVSANVEVPVFELGKMVGQHRVLDPSSETQARELSPASYSESGSDPGLAHTAGYMAAAQHPSVVDVVAAVVDAGVGVVRQHLPSDTRYSSGFEQTNQREAVRAPAQTVSAAVVRGALAVVVAAC